MYQLACKHNRLLKVSGKTSDCCCIQYGDRIHDGYVPYDIGIGGGDYLEFDLCLDCGKIVGKFPISEEEVQKALDRRY